MGLRARARGSGIKDAESPPRAGPGPGRGAGPQAACWCVDPADCRCGHRVASPAHGVGFPQLLKHVVINNRSVFSHILEAGSPNSRVTGARLPASGGPSCLFQLRVAADGLGLWPRDPATTWLFPCVSRVLSSSSKDTMPGLTAHPSVLTNYICKHPFPIKAHSEVLGGREFGEEAVYPAR